MTHLAACPRCGGPLDLEGRCAACEPARVGGPTQMVPIQPPPNGAVLGAAVAAGDDLGRVALPEGWDVSLDVISGPSKGNSFRLTQSRVLLGRGSVDVVIVDPRVSRRHASLEVYGTVCVLVKDLGSTNGTFVNGRRITACELQDGDEITVGDTTLQITIGAAP
ncbi:MAG: FHA domain-containing protein [Candidatus Polarisedimenticolia bacterium]|nr:FHA domain-containing protein [bacterium]